jgi:DNA invertase Pin-like site-specific DNA recombinase
MGTKTKGPRIAAYLRQSSTDVGSVSIEAQEAAIRSFAAAKGWQVVEVYTDADTSGRSGTKRPDFARMMSDAPQYDGVASWRLDRLTRGGIVEFAQIVKDLDAAGTFYTSVQEPEVNTQATSPLGKLIMMIIAHFAEMESDTIRERVSAARAEIRGKGRWVSGQAPFGFRVEETGNGERELREVPAEAAVIRGAADKLLAGESITTAVAWVTEQGLPTRRGATMWTRTSLCNVLRSPTVAGWVSHDEGWNDPKAPRNLRPFIGPDGVPVSSGDAILDPETWRRVQDLFAERKVTKARSRANGPLLGGRIRCGSFGGRMKKAGGTSYTCPASGEKPGSCTPNSIQLSRTDALVLATVREAVPGWLERGRIRQAERAAASDTTGDRIEQLKQGLRQQTASIRDLRNSGASAFLIAQEEAARLDTDAELLALQAEADAKAATTAFGAVAAKLGGEDPQAAFDALVPTDDYEGDPAGLRQVLRALVEEVTIAPREGAGRAWQAERVSVRFTTV